MNAETCPHCAANLQGAPIPEKDRHCYGTSTHFSRTIGVEVPGVYDGVLYWRCPDCGGKWSRWREGTELHEIAERLIAST